MKLVIDANIVISCLISGRVSEILFSPKLELYAPELLFTEVRKHKQELTLKSALSEADIDLLLLLIEKQVTIVPQMEFSSEFAHAETLLKEHRKDIQYVSLAMHLKCPIWSYEKRFDMIGSIETLTTQQIINLIR